jgi:hypothetical protein
MAIFDQRGEKYARESYETGTLAGMSQIAGSVREM